MTDEFIPLAVLTANSLLPLRGSAACNDVLVFALYLIAWSFLAAAEFCK